MELRIRRERMRRGWTLEYTAKAAGITKSAYRNVEVGMRKPSYDVLIRLLTLFEYDDPRELFGEETPEKEEAPGRGRVAKKFSQN